MNKIKFHRKRIFSIVLVTMLLLIGIGIQGCSNGVEFNEANLNEPIEQGIASKRFKAPGESGGGGYTNYHYDITTTTNISNTVKLVKRRYTVVESNSLTWELIDSYTKEMKCSADTYYYIFVPYAEEKYYVNDVLAYSIRYIDTHSDVLGGATGVIATFVNTNINTPPYKGNGFSVNLSDKKAKIKCKVTGRAIFPCDPKPGDNPYTIIAPDDFYIE